MRSIDAVRKLWMLVLLVSGFFQTSGAQQAPDSLDIKIGQMILIGFPGTVADPKVLEEIRTGKVGSIIIFEKNIPPQNSFIALKKIIWTYQQAARIPLLIGIDQEGGRVNRLKDKYGFPRSITAAAMGKDKALDSVRFYSQATASTLSGLGININFAPVVDLATNPNNPIIAKYGRAFSANEDSVMLMAREVVIQHHRHGVLTSLKHFPGHGSSEGDTHLGLTDVTHTWSDRELKPYRVLIDSGYADAVMTSHIVNRNLDKKGYPGTLSADVLTGILRNQMHFNGVVFTDDMQMHAITKNYGLEEAIKLAINAGVDIMTFSNNISGSEERTVDKVHEIIRNLVQRGEITKDRIDQSYKRVMKLKAKLTSTENLEYANTKERMREAEVEQEALRKANKALEQELAQLKAATAEQGKKKKKRKKD